MTEEQKYTVMVVMDRIVRRPYTTYGRDIEAESGMAAIRKAREVLERLPDPPGAGWEEGEAFDPELTEPAFFLLPSVGDGSRVVTAEEFLAELAPGEESGIKQEDETLPIVLEVRANDAEHRVEVGSVTHLKSDLGDTDSWLWMLPAIVLEVAEQVCPGPGDSALLYEHLRRRVELEMTRLIRAE